MATMAANIAAFFSAYFLPHLRPSRPKLCCFSVFIPSFVVLAVLAHHAVKLNVTMGTVAGHNLKPTPWHLFEPKKLDDGYSKIVKCSLLSSCTTLLDWTRFGGRRRRKSGWASTPECPFVFRWIREDLAPWVESGITEADVAAAKEHAAMRVMVIGGRLFADLYYACVESRVLFTLWGFLQLLRRYPGNVPDVDLMFDCMDRPVIERLEVQRRPPPPLFRYSTTPRHYDIPFPDWSFWGWPEVNIAPWAKEFADIKSGAMALNWSSKHPFAYWKGNPNVSSPVRFELLQCNESQAWKAQILRQDWEEERRAGFQQSNLSSQCGHRYKIYAEEYAWSVSLKYILACGSMSLIIEPEYQDFFSRGLEPMKDYWPIKRDELCPSIKYAVKWGNDRPDKAKAIGKGGQDYMAELNMEHVYDYMYHLISEYHKLQRFKPEKPPSAQEICEDSILCYADDKQKQFLAREFQVSSSSSKNIPCTLPPQDHHLIAKWLQDKAETNERVARFRFVDGTE